MSERTLHPDWPPLDLTKCRGTDTYSLPAPLYDVASALDAARPMTAEPVPVAGDAVHLGDFAEVLRYRVSYHGIDWTPERNDGGTELTMNLVARLTDGRFVSISAGNDYTGWGCQDYADVRVAATEEQLVAFGLSNEDRAALGYPAVTS